MSKIISFLDKYGFKRGYWILAIALLSAITWSSSITNEYVGYDDIKLMVRNERVHKGPLYTLKFYGNFVTDSNNLAWTRKPTTVYRPMEWVGTSIGYKFWQDSAWHYHFFFNFSLHIFNAIMLFLILIKLLEGLGTDYERKKILIAGVITSLWVVHPLHNEAVNMLTSGVGFLWATSFALMAIVLNMYTRDALFVLIAFGLLLTSYFGAEMCIITPVLLTLFFFYQGTLKQNMFRLGVSYFTIVVYMIHRMSIVTEHQSLVSQSLVELSERVFVLAPQILFHYVKLFFFPAVLTHDQHHQVYLDGPFSLYHLLAFGVSLFMVVAAVALFRSNRMEKRFIGMSLSLSILWMLLSLNILPIYCLARERYTYLFVLGLFAALVMFIYCKVVLKWNFLKPGEEESPKLTKKSKNIKSFKSRNKDAPIDTQIVKHATILFTIFVLLLVGYGTRAFVKNFDWRDGERFWLSAMKNTPDLGARQVWRFQLFKYFTDPGTKTFKPQHTTKNEVLKDLIRFAYDNKLFERAGKLDQEKVDPFVYKYGYRGRRTIASAIYFAFMSMALQNNPKYLKPSLQMLDLALLYDPDHFQTNLNMLKLVGPKDEGQRDYFLKLLDKDGKDNPFLAKGILDILFTLPDDQVTYEYAKRYHEQFVNAQAFNNYHFFAAVKIKDYQTAYAEAKLMASKYNSVEPRIIKFIRDYEQLIALAQSGQVKDLSVLERYDISEQFLKNKMKREIEKNYKVKVPAKK